MKTDELTMSQVVALLGVSRLTVLRWSKKGILKFRTQRLGAYDWKFYKRSDVLKVKADMEKRPAVGHSYLRSIERKKKERH